MFLVKYLNAFNNLKGKHTYASTSTMDILYLSFFLRKILVIVLTIIRLWTVLLFLPAMDILVSERLINSHYS